MGPLEPNTHHPVDTGTNGGTDESTDAHTHTHTYTDTDENEDSDEEVVGTPIAIVERTVARSAIGLESVEHVTTADGRTILAVTLDTGDSFIVEYDPSMIGVSQFFQLTIQEALRQLQDRQRTT